MAPKMTGFGACALGNSPQKVGLRSLKFLMFWLTVYGGHIFWGQGSVLPFGHTEGVICPWAIIASRGKMYPMPGRGLEETQLTSRDMHQYLLD